MVAWIVISLIIAALAFLGFHSVDSLTHDGCNGNCGSCSGFEEPSDINRKR
ncbi:MAG: FeoB-associated Cys-rich membrane protein [Oscillospiraceae bacterium]|nr:FeoB-associated Cys-rich membrane protein [Oscillospiraceae bacterium]